MSRKLWLSTVTVMVALLAVFAGSAVAKSAKTGATGGTMTVDLSTDVDYTDPALSYLSTGWELEYATCLKLMNYPDANGARGSNLVAEAAAGYPRVSGNGKVYDFTVNAGFTKFSNGQPVTAATFTTGFGGAIVAVAVAAGAGETDSGATAGFGFGAGFGAGFGGAGGVRSPL